MKELFDLERKNSSNEIIISTKDKVTSDKDIAIIGISVKLPMVNNLNDFRNIVKNKLDTIGELSERRKQDCENYSKNTEKDEELLFKKGSFLESIDEFDCSHFKITPMEAKLMNPNQRLLLESTYSALDDAGYANDLIRGQNVGVFIGFIDIDSYKYKEMILKNESKTNIDLSVVGNLNSMIPSRISYHLNLKGPSMLIDTACSSSLVAVHEACKSIINGDCESALVGSARINILPIEDNIKIGIDSEKGIVRAFDKDADGTCTGEGIISVYLKPLKKAIEDRDNVYAVIKGSAINQDGATVGITAPSAEAQKDVILKAWKNSGINPEDIEDFESHGTATKIGDVIELEAIKKAFDQYTKKKQFCAITSVKSNIGHLYDGSGLASLAKAIIQIKNKELLPTANFINPNSKIKFEELPVYVNDRYRKWETEKERRTSGISSFGFSGTNCHLVLQEYKETKKEVNKRNNYNILTLSAKTEEKLLVSIKEFKEFISDDKSLVIENLCYTTNNFKAVYDKKLAIIFSNREDLINKLEDLTFKKNISSSIIVEINSLEQRNEEIDILVDTANRFINNEKIFWGNIYKDLNLKKISTPTYSFDRKRCWLDLKAKDIISKEKYYQINWIKNDIDICDLEVLKRKIIIFRSENSDMDEIMKVLRRKNIEVFDIIINNILDIKEILNNEEIQREIQKCDNIIYSLGISTKNCLCIEEVKEIQNKGILGFSKLIQELMNKKLKEDIKIAILTTNSMNILGSEESIIENSVIHGIGMVAAIECSNFRIKAIDFDLSTNTELILNEILTDTSQYLVSYRNNQRYIQELDQLKSNSNNLLRTPFIDGNTYIVTGGLGFLGGETCKYITSRCKGNIIILGRRELDNHDLESNSVIKEIKESGSSVEYYSVDISDFNKLKVVVEIIKLKYKIISGVIHGAGKGDNGLIINKTMDEIEEIISTKVYGTWNLLKLLSEEKLDFFAMFSSGLTIISEYGQGPYIAGNMYLDNLANYKSDNIRRMITINWPVIKGGGIATQYNYENRVLKSINVEEVKSTLDFVFATNTNRVIVGEIKESIESLKIIEGLPIKVSDTIINLIHKKVNKSEVENIEITISENHINDSYETILDNIINVFNRVTGIEDVDTQVNLFEVGIDSILFTKLHNEINIIYPGKISISQMFSFSNIEKISNCIYENLKSIDKKINKVEECIEKDISNNLLEIFDKAGNDDISIEDMIKEIEKL